MNNVPEVFEELKEEETFEVDGGRVVVKKPEDPPVGPWCGRQYR